MQIPNNISQLIKKKGLQAGIPYVGKVVDDNDPSQLFRLRVRVPGIFDHLEDDELPWAVPDSENPNGITGGENVGRTQSVAIPEAGSEVALYFNQNGDPHQPTYTTRMPIAKDKVAPEFLKNYPKRQGSVLPSGYTFIHDRQTNETFLELPGDANLTILGDVNLNVVGNIQAHAHSSTSSLPAYIAAAPERLIGQLRPDPQRKINFNGLKGGSSGNIHLEAENHVTVKAGGDFKLESSNVEIDASREHTQKSGGRTSIKAGSKVSVKGSQIHLN
tara:strand:- start:5915 stop:6736 length:822 start_codon:yes stop_codon:yes gene_type:complete